MNIQFSGAFVSARIPRGVGGMSALETSAALESAEQEKDGYIKSGKAQRAEVVMLDYLSQPALPKETGMLLIIATDDDADFYNHVLDKPAHIQAICSDDLYEKALASEKAEAENPMPDPIKISTRLEKQVLEGDAASVGTRLGKMLGQMLKTLHLDQQDMISSGKAVITCSVSISPDEVPEMSENLLGMSVVISGKDAKEWNMLKQLHNEHPDKKAFLRKIYEKALASEAAEKQTN